LSYEPVYAYLRETEHEGGAVKTPLRSERELDMIRGKMLVNAASQEELHDFLRYVTVLEGLVEDASMADFYGTEGWRHKIGLV